MTRAVARLQIALITATGAVQHHISRASSRRDRGDVPGWVLITVMTAGLVSAIWLLAGPILTTMFQDSLSKVTGK
jgi:hypothetical protein